MYIGICVPSLTQEWGTERSRLEALEGLGACVKLVAKNVSESPNSVAISVAARVAASVATRLRTLARLSHCCSSSPHLSLAASDGERRLTPKKLLFSDTDAMFHLVCHSPS